MGSCLISVWEDEKVLETCSPTLWIDVTVLIRTRTTVRTVNLLLGGFLNHNLKKDIL